MEVHEPPTHAAVALVAAEQRWPQLPQLFTSVLVSTHVPPKPRMPPHFWPQTAEPVQHPEHVDELHPPPEASRLPASGAPESDTHVPPEQVAPTVVQSEQTLPADPQVLSEGDWQLPLVSQQPTHVWAQAAPSAVASATDPSSPVLPVSPWT